MNEELRARIAGVLQSAGLKGFKDTTTPDRPQWRASFSLRQKMAGEMTYVHLHVPADGERLQVNSSIHAGELNKMPADRLSGEFARVNESYVTGSESWDKAIRALGAHPEALTSWQAVASPYVGLRDRMILSRVSMPLEDMSNLSVDLAIRLGIGLARTVREDLRQALKSERK